MATDKQFTVIGVSTLNGDTKVRFANDTMRIKILAKNGHTDIQLIELPESLTKVAAVNAIKDLPEFADQAAQDAIAEYLAKNDKTPKVTVKKAVKAAVVKKSAVTAPTVDMDEDAPF